MSLFYLCYCLVNHVLKSSNQVLLVIRKLFKLIFAHRMLYDRGKQFILFWVDVFIPLKQRMAGDIVLNAGIAFVSAPSRMTDVHLHLRLAVTVIRLKLVDSRRPSTMLRVR
jgi:hypothetical protein